MRTSVPLTEKQRKAMLPYKQNVGEVFRTVELTVTNLEIVSDSCN
jgi:hypothetical protein